MTPRVVVVDTNVLVAGLLTGRADSPTAIIVRGMLESRFVFMLSTALLAEYRQVLLRDRVAELHGLTEDQIDLVLAEIVANAVIREPEHSVDEAPEKGDQHLWDLMACEHGTVLVTGDGLLLEEPADRASVVSPAVFAEWYRDS
jgi:putative PIN family toxin of toxin-antitoxin system